MSQAIRQRFEHYKRNFDLDYELREEKGNQNLYVFNKYIGTLCYLKVKGHGEDQLVLRKVESYKDIYRKYVGFSIQTELLRFVDYFQIKLKGRDLVMSVNAAIFVFNGEFIEVSEGNISYTKTILPISYWDCKVEKELNKVILDNLGPEWYVLLYNLFTEDPEFKRIAALYWAEKKSGKTLYPSFKNLFDFLKNVPASKLSTIILSEEPYSSEGEATGVPYECLKRETPALRTIKAALKEDGYDYSDESFKNWQEQGVMFANRNLFVEKDNPKSYSESNTHVLIKKIIDNFLLITGNPIVLGAFGRKNNAFADEVISYVKKPFLIKKVHIGVKPGDHNFANSGFSTKINSILKKQINW